MINLGIVNFSIKWIELNMASIIIEFLFDIIAFTITYPSHVIDPLIYVISKFDH